MKLIRRRLTFAFSAIMVLSTSHQASARTADPNNPDDLAKAQEIISEVMLKNVVEMQKQLPLKMDEQTTMISVAFSAMRMARSYRLNVSGKDIEFAKLRNNVISNNCNEEHTRRSFDFGLKNVFVYFDKDERLIGTVVVDKTACR